MSATLDDVITFIRADQYIGEGTPITATTLLEADLGITGDDGSELLEGLQKHFAISFAGPDGSLREAFGLQPGEYLFHSEGLGFFQWLAGCFGKDIENVKPLSVGELHRVIARLSGDIPRST